MKSIYYRYDALMGTVFEHSCHGKTKRLKFGFQKSYSGLLMSFCNECGWVLCCKSYEGLVMDEDDKEISRFTLSPEANSLKGLKHLCIFENVISLPKQNKYVCKGCGTKFLLRNGCLYMSRGLTIVKHHKGLNGKDVFNVDLGGVKVRVSCFDGSIVSQL